MHQSPRVRPGTIAPLALGLLAATLVCSAQSAAPSPAAAQVRHERAVYVGVYLRDVSRFEQREGVFDVDLDMWAKWSGEFDRDALTIANAAEAEQEFLGEETDGDWHSARWRVRGTLRGEFPMQRFPFDRQTLPIVFELIGVHGRLAPDLASSSTRPRFSVTDWVYHPVFHPKVEEEVLGSDLGHLGHEGQPTVVHRVTFQLSVERPLAPVALKLFLPLVIIILVAFASLFLHPEQVEARSGMAVTALLSCFAFQFTVADTLPTVTYVTLADTLFLIGYVLSGATVGLVILSTGLMRAGRESTAVLVDRVMRVALPLVGALAVWLSWPPPEPPLESDVVPVPSPARAESSRDVLRFGTTLLTRVSNSPLGTATTATLVDEHPIDGDLVLYVERAPGVENDSLHLLADGRVRVTWTLREGVRWSDGEPLTSDDLRFAAELSPDEDVASIATPDARTFEVTWHRALAEALEPPWPYPAHVFREVTEEGGHDALVAYRAERIYPTLGPYRFVEYVAGDRLVAEANPHFPGPPPAIPRVELRLFEDSERLIAAFEAGEVDLTAPNSITPDEVRALRERGVEGVHVQPSSALVFLDLDLSHPLLAHRDARRALLMAIDREALRDALYSDHGRVAHAPSPRDPPADLARVAYDPAGARAILAGYPAELAAPIPLFTAGRAFSLQTAGLIADYLRAVGVNVELREVRNTLSLRRNHDHGGLALSVSLPSVEASKRWWGLAIVDGQYPPDARNEAYDDEVHALFDHLERSLYPERRESLNEAILHRYAERLPGLPLIFANERVLATPSLRGWDEGPAEASFSAAMDTWRFE